MKSGNIPSSGCGSDWWIWGSSWRTFGPSGAPRKKKKISRGPWQRSEYFLNFVLLYSYVQKCRLMRFNTLYEYSSQSVIFILLHIWQNYVCFGDLMGKGTLYLYLYLGFAPTTSGLDLPLLALNPDLPMLNPEVTGSNPTEVKFSY